MAQVAETRLVLTDARVKECAQLFRELWEVCRGLDQAQEPPLGPVPTQPQTNA